MFLNLPKHSAWQKEPGKLDDGAGCQEPKHDQASLVPVGF